MSTASKQRETLRGRRWVKGSIGSAQVRILSGLPGSILKASDRRYLVRDNGQFFRMKKESQCLTS